MVPPEQNTAVPNPLLKHTPITSLSETLTYKFSPEPYLYSVIEINP